MTLDYVRSHLLAARDANARACFFKAAKYAEALKRLAGITLD